MDNWSQLMQNPRGMVLKRFMLQILGNKVGEYDELLTRISTTVITDGDLKSFGDMINAVLAVGYRKAVDDYKDQLSKLGIGVNLISQQNSADNHLLHQL
jgi:hypothetical protein